MHTSGSAQFQILDRYFDLGALLRLREKNSTEELENKTFDTSQKYLLIEAATLAEKLSKTKQLSSRTTTETKYIDYNNYKSICSYYLNPLQKTKCNNRYNYLINAHKKVLELVTITPKHSINIGIKEQIGQKYAHITNTIYLALEDLKLKAEKDNYYKMLLIK